MIAFDTESTGLMKPELADPKIQPFITEIYMCKFDWDGNILDELETFIHPLMPIPEKITEITGITNEMVSDAPKFIEAFDDIADFCLGEEDIFAHNCSFDMDILRAEMTRYDLQYRFPWPRRQHCTVELSMPIQNKRLALPKLYKIATGKELFGNHRAKVDVHAMVECIVWMKKEGFIK